MTGIPTTFPRISVAPARRLVAWGHHSQGCIVRDQPLMGGMDVAAYAGMRMRMQLLQLHAHVCACCGTIRNEDDIQERLLEIALFGCVWENICPSCYRDLDEDEREDVHDTWAQIQKDQHDDEDEDEI